MYNNAHECVWEKTPPLSGKNPTYPDVLELKLALELDEEVHVEQGAVRFLPDDGERRTRTSAKWSLPPDELVTLCRTDGCRT